MAGTRGTDRPFEEYLKDVAGTELDLDNTLALGVDDKVNDNVNDNVTPAKEHVHHHVHHPPPPTVATTISTPVNDTEDAVLLAKEQQEEGEDDFLHSSNTNNRDRDSSRRGPLSPFSPLLKKTRRRPEGSLSWKAHDERDLSMAACRRVSVVVNVHHESSSSTAPSSPLTNNNTNKLCLFPLVTTTATTTPLQGDSPTKEQQHQQHQHHQHTPPSPVTATLQSAKDARDLVMVNPTAFGKHNLSSGELTMETARQVAQIAAGSTEDWARTFRFHQVLWPGETGLKSLSNLVRAIVNDVTSISSISVRTIVGMGNAAAKTNSLFGMVGTQSVAQVFSQAADNLDSAGILQRYGVLGLTAHEILQQTAHDDGRICTMSILEIAEEDVLYDLLATRPFATVGVQHLRLRYSGELHGAKIQGLSDVPLDSLKGLGHCLRRAFAAALHKHRKQTRGHIIATLKVWNNQDSSQHGNNRKRTKYTSVQFVDLATVQTTKTAASARRNASVRKSTSTLGGILRSTLLKEAGNETMISYRESTLTKVMQRSLDHPDSRVVVLANVSPLSDSYDESMATLRFVSRLLYRPGQPAQSPFDTPSKATSPTSLASTSQSALSLDQFPGREELLANMLSDPRQRLAKIMKPSQRRVAVNAMESGVEAYIPTKYMDVDPATIVRHSPDEKPMRRYEPEGKTPHYDATMPTPVARNGQGRGNQFDNREPDGHVTEQHSKPTLHSIDTRYTLNIEHGTDSDSDDGYGYVDPSPLTANTGEGYLNAFCCADTDNFGLDDLAQRALQNKLDLAGQAMVSNEPLPIESDDAVAIDATSNLLGWNDDTYDLGHQHDSAHSVHELSAEPLLRSLATTPNDTPARIERPDSPNTQEMDDLSAELFKKSNMGNANVDQVEQSRDLLEGQDFRPPPPQQFSSQSTVDSSLPSYDMPPEQRSRTFERPTYRRPIQVTANSDLVPETNVEAAGMTSEVNRWDSQSEGAPESQLGTSPEKSIASSNLKSAALPSDEVFEIFQPAVDTSAAPREQFNAREAAHPETSTATLDLDQPPQEYHHPMRQLEEEANVSDQLEVDRLAQYQLELLRRQQEVQAAKLELDRKAQHHRSETEQREQVANVAARQTAQEYQRAMDQRVQDVEAAKVEADRQSQQYQRELQLRESEARVASQRELDRQSREYQDALEQRDHELAMLQGKLRKVENDKGEVLKIAEEAIATQAELEERVTELEGELSVQASQNVNRDDVVHLEGTNGTLSRELHEMRNELFQCKAELNDRGITVSELQFALGSFENERAQLMELRSQDQEEVQMLREYANETKDQNKEVMVLKNEISRLQRENASLETTNQRRESELLHQIADKDAYIERCEQETHNLKAELAAVHEIEKSQQQERRRETSGLEKRAHELQQELSMNQEQYEEDRTRFDVAVRSQVELKQELESAKDNLNDRISDVEELSLNLKTVLEEKAEGEAVIADMERALGSFQNETRTRVERVVQHRNEAASLLETTLGENQALADANEDLQAALDDMRHELDDARRPRARSETFTATPSRDRRERADRASNSYPSGDETRWTSDPLSRAVDNSGGYRREREGFHGTPSRPSGSLGDWQRPFNDHDVRAEEVAAYVAASAKKSMERSNTEAVHLRQQLYRLEDSKHAEIEALKARIRGLERRVDPRGYS